MARFEEHPIEPIDDAARALVLDRVSGLLAGLTELFDFDFPEIPVTFDLTGRCAGMYRIRNRRREIRFNPYLFAKYWQENLETTVPHEVAHYAADRIHGYATIRPHGPEWRRIMLVLGADPSVTANFDLTGIPRRKHKQYHYHCRCDVHQLTSVRHNRIRRGQQRYLCRRCDSELVLVEI